MSRARPTPRPSLTRIAVAGVLSLAGAALLAWQVRRSGPAAIVEGLRQVGWGFLVILAVSLARFALRSLAWTTLMGGRTSLAAAIGATLAGDAIGNLTPLSLLVSEPAKSLFLRDRIPGARSFPALTAENFFYSVSVAIFVILGTVAMLEAFAVPPELRWAGLVSLALMATVLAGALWIGWREPAFLSALVQRVPIRAVSALFDRARAFEAATYGFLRQRERPLGVVIACETAFHALSFLEAYYTIWLMTGRSAPLAAFVLDTFNRIVNVVFRAMPLRIGVDEASTALVAPAVGFTSAIGVTIALVRKGRMLIWAATGIALAVRKGLRWRDVIETEQEAQPGHDSRR